MQVGNATGQPHTSGHPRSGWQRGKEGWKGLDQPLNPLLPGRQGSLVLLSQCSWKLGNDSTPRTPPHTPGVSPQHLMGQKNPSGTQRC